MTRRGVLTRTAWLLGVLLLVALGWWLLVPRDVSTTTQIDAVLGLPTSTTLEVSYMAGDPNCAAPGGVSVEEKSDEVRLTASTISHDVRPFTAKACPAVERPANDTVHLSAPLGDRRVIDTTRDGDGVIPVEAP